jgi:hypothetical protein
MITFLILNEINTVYTLSPSFFGIRFNIASRRLYKSLLFRSVPARLVHPEDVGDTILRNVGSYKSHTASSPRRW